MNEHDKELISEPWEEKINALLEGELDQDESEALKAEASSDQKLARAIVDAYQLQRAMENVQTERAPASLRRSLKKIPQQNRPLFFQPRWAMAFAVVPLVIASVMILKSTQPSDIQAPGPQAGLSSAEMVKLEQARNDLAVAFAYIDLVSDRTSNRIESEVGGEMSKAVAGSIFRNIQQQKLL
jgi:anti-sigma factor RsiW